MKRRGLTFHDESGLKDAQERGDRYYKKIPFLEGRILKSRNASGELVDYVDFPHNSKKVLSHPLNREVTGFLVLDAFTTDGVSTAHSLVRVENTVPGREREEVTFYASSATSRVIRYRILVY